MLSVKELLDNVRGRHARGLVRHVYCIVNSLVGCRCKICLLCVAKWFIINIKNKIQKNNVSTFVDQCGHLVDNVYNRLDYCKYKSKGQENHCNVCFRVIAYALVREFMQPWLDGSLTVKESDNTIVLFASVIVKNYRHANIRNCSCQFESWNINMEESREIRFSTSNLLYEYKPVADCHNGCFELFVEMLLEQKLYFCLTHQFIHRKMGKLEYVYNKIRSVAQECNNFKKNTRCKRHLTDFVVEIGKICTCCEKPPNYKKGVEFVYKVMCKKWFFCHSCVKS